jgi:hypothetical protein
MEKVTQRVEKIKQSRMEMLRASAEQLEAVQDMVSEEKNSEISMSDFRSDNNDMNLMLQ